jgi:hypothetical protein
MLIEILGCIFASPLMFSRNIIVCKEFKLKECGTHQEAQI